MPVIACYLLSFAHFAVLGGEKYVHEEDRSGHLGELQRTVPESGRYVNLGGSGEDVFFHMVKVFSKLYLNTILCITALKDFCLLWLSQKWVQT